MQNCKIKDKNRKTTIIHSSFHEFGPADVFVWDLFIHKLERSAIQVQKDELVDFKKHFLCHIQLRIDILFLHLDPVESAHLRIHSRLDALKVLQGQILDSSWGFAAFPESWQLHSYALFI